MMLEVSGVGAVVDIDRIPRPPSVTPEDWVLLYQGCGFVMAGAIEHERRLVDVCTKAGLTCARVGEIVNDTSLMIESGAARAQVFDLAAGGVTGIGPVRR
jgi:selenophosphate synthetase-related protein